MIILKARDTPRPDGVPLSVKGGRCAIVDAHLLPYLTRFTWRWHKSAASWYVVTSKRRGKKVHHVKLHRLITKCPKSLKVHHVNHDTADNRLSNLSVITEREHRHFDGWHIFAV